MIAVASRAGLGYLVMDAREFLQTDTMIAGLVVIGAVGAIYSRLFPALQRRCCGIARSLRACECKRENRRLRAVVEIAACIAAIEALVLVFEEILGVAS